MTQQEYKQSLAKQFYLQDYDRAEKAADKAKEQNADNARLHKKDGKWSAMNFALSGANGFQAGAYGYIDTSNGKTAADFTYEQIHGQDDANGQHIAGLQDAFREKYRKEISKYGESTVLQAVEVTYNVNKDTVKDGGAYGRILDGVLKQMKAGVTNPTLELDEAHNQPQGDDKNGKAVRVDYQIKSGNVTMGALFDNGVGEAQAIMAVLLKDAPENNTNFQLDKKRIQDGKGFDEKWLGLSTANAKALGFGDGVFSPELLAALEKTYAKEVMHKDNAASPEIQESVRAEVAKLIGSNPAVKKAADKLHASNGGGSVTGDEQNFVIQPPPTGGAYERPGMHKS
jgi:hypothetical protein